MVEVTEEGVLQAPAADVWKLVGDFGGFIEALGIPVELEGHGVGQIRSTMKVVARDDGTARLTWTGTCQAAPGGTEEEAEAIVRAIYQGGIGALKGRLES